MRGATAPGHGRRGHMQPLAFLLVLVTVAVVPIALFHGISHDGAGAGRKRSGARDAGRSGRWGNVAFTGMPDDIHRPGAPVGPGDRQRDMHVSSQSFEFSPVRRKMDEVFARAGRTTTHTNRTPLAHESSVASHQKSVNAGPADALNASFSIGGMRVRGHLPRITEQLMLPLPQQLPASAQSAPTNPASHAASSQSPRWHVERASGCGEMRGAVLTSWDEPLAVSAAGEACSLFSVSLNAAFHQRFDFAPGEFQVGGAYDFEKCYVYAGHDCWVVHERSAALPCTRTTDLEAPLSDDSDLGEASVERHTLLWQLRRAVHLGRLSAPGAPSAHQVAKADGGSDSFGGVFGPGFGRTGPFFSSFRDSSGPWGRRALDVASEVAVDSGWETVSVIMHGDELDQQIEDAVSELPMALVVFSAVTPAALDHHTDRLQSQAQMLPVLSALRALAPQTLQALVRSPAVWTVAIVEDVRSLGDAALPHEMQATLGSLLLLSHVTLLPLGALEEASLLSPGPSPEDIPSILRRCVALVDADARVEIDTKRQDVVQVTVVASESRRFVAVDLDEHLCGARSGGVANGGSGECHEGQYALKMTKNQASIYPVLSLHAVVGDVVAHGGDEGVQKTAGAIGDVGRPNTSKGWRQGEKLLPHGHFPLASISEIGLRPSQLREIMVQTSMLPLPQSLDAHLPWRLVLQLFLRGGDTGSSCEAVVLPLVRKTDAAAAVRKVSHEREKRDSGNRGERDQEGAEDEEVDDRRDTVGGRGKGKDTSQSDAKAGQGNDADTNGAKGANTEEGLESGNGKAGGQEGGAGKRIKHSPMDLAHLREWGKQASQVLRRLLVDEGDDADDHDAGVHSGKERGRLGDAGEGSMRVGGDSNAGACEQELAGWRFIKSCETCASEHGQLLAEQLSPTARVLVVGSELSLLSLKMAALLPGLTMLVLHEEAAAADSHHTLARMLGVSRVFVCQRPLSMRVLHDMMQLPEPFDAAVLGPSVLALMADRERGEMHKMLVKLLSFASSTYLLWPGPNALRAALQVNCVLQRPSSPWASEQVTFARNLSTSFDTKTLLSAAASEAGRGNGERDASGAEVRLLAGHERGTAWGAGAEWRKVHREEKCAAQLWHVRIGRLARRVIVAGNTHGSAKLILTRAGVMSVLVSSAGADSGVGGEEVFEEAWHGRDGVSLEALQMLRLVNKSRAELFRSYLELNLHADMHPVHFVAVGTRVMHAPLVPLGGAGAGSGGVLRRRGAASDLAACNMTKTVGLSGLCKEVQQRDLAVAGVLERTISPNCDNFSFVEYGSGTGVLAIQLAQAFPGSSIVSVEGDRALHHRHAAHLRQLPLKNNIACHADTHNVVDKLYESPEFVRFQMVAPLPHMLALDGSDSQVLGKMFSCGMTTFMRVPSPRLLSSAVHTIFPEEAPRMAGAGDKDLELLVEELVESAVVPLKSKSEVTVSLLGDVKGHVLVRVHLLNMSRTAHHHFDYKRDGHSRVYEMMFRSAGGPTPAAAEEPENAYLPGQLRLLRREDDHAIPFGELVAVSLIALLRMGLHEMHRRHFYKEFVAMPLFEDMAPWNIVFVGPRLAYIDQDTLDKTFNDAVPRAYQTMSALMNYIRTVQDFGKCGPKSRGGNQYGIPYISDCVGSDFRGPCLSSELPVPCGDRTCRSTFVECLAALMDEDSSKHSVPRMGVIAGAKALHVSLSKQ